MPYAEMKEDVGANAYTKEVKVGNRRTLYQRLQPYFMPCMCFCGSMALLIVFLWYSGFISFDPPSCAGPVQSDLKFGCDEELPLASKICCHNTRFAEPAGFQSQPGIDLFSRLNRSAETVFYDSICGIPLFVAPRGRSFAAWEAESKAHGWPSFRQEEVIAENIDMKFGGEVRSTCGVHLGHRFSDGSGNRYCIDLVCIAGHQTVHNTSAEILGISL